VSLLEQNRHHIGHVILPVFVSTQLHEIQCQHLFHYIYTTWVKLTSKRTEQPNPVWTLLCLILKQHCYNNLNIRLPCHGLSQRKETQMLCQSKEVTNIVFEWIRDRRKNIGNEKVSPVQLRTSLSSVGRTSYWQSVQDRLWS